MHVLGQSVDPDQMSQNVQNVASDQGVHCFSNYRIGMGRYFGVPFIWVNMVLFFSGAVFYP